jgi:ubiquinone biosynthesis protein COQ4
MTVTPMNADEANPYRIRWGEGLRALKALRSDKEDTTAVFRIIGAFSGKTRMWSANQFKVRPAAKAMLAKRPNLLQALLQRDKLAAMPQGTLGHAYFMFTYGENLSPDGLIEASEEAGEGNRAGWDEDSGWIGMRSRDSHDLWHVVTGYGREGFGELSLLAFTYAQVRNRGIAAILPLGVYTVKKIGSRLPVLRALYEGYRRGKKAVWLPETEWEVLLEKPLDEVRALLKITPAPIYAKAKADAVALDRSALEARTAAA